MTYKPGIHVYLAAPFFNDEQKELCEFIEGHDRGDQPIYSPRLDGGVLKPDSSNEHRKTIFASNCVAIDTAQWVLAVIDDFDAGVIWEMGYAHANGIPTLGYSDVEGRGLNVMLAGSCNLGFLNGRNVLEDLLRYNAVWDWDRFPKNTWSGEIQ